MFDMDDGFLGAYPTRSEAVDAVRDAPVLRRWSYGPGAYEYIFGFPDEDSTTTRFIERLDVVESGQGWDITAWNVAGRPMGCADHTLRARG